MATSIGVQAVLAGGGQPPPVPQKRTSDSLIVGVDGDGWRKALENDSVTYYNDGHGLYLRMFARNGGAGGSGTDSFLVDLDISNDDDRTYKAIFSLFMKQHWVKESISFHANDISYISSNGTVYQPTGVRKCDFQAKNIPSEPPQLVTIPAGSGTCLRLVFSAEPPLGTTQFQVRIAKLLLGGRPIDRITMTFGPRDL
jgi:hypothetical protein